MFGRGSIYWIGVFAHTDAQGGVWKAPAGLEATLTGVPELSVPLIDAEDGELNSLGINCLRVMPVVAVADVLPRPRLAWLRSVTKNAGRT